MKHQFTLPDFENSLFEIEISMLTGKPTLYQDGKVVERSKEKGKPFLLKTNKGVTIAATPKLQFPDTIPALEINGVKHLLVEKLKWYEYLIGGLPLILMFVGGAIGGVIGMMCTMINFNIIRQEPNLIKKYFKIIALTAWGVVTFIFLAESIRGLFM